jgi:hypothetical protein
MWMEKIIKGMMGSVIPIGIFSQYSSELIFPEVEDLKICIIGILSFIFSDVPSKAYFLWVTFVYFSYFMSQ